MRSHLSLLAVTFLYNNYRLGKENVTRNTIILWRNFLLTSRLLLIYPVAEHYAARWSYTIGDAS